MPLDLTAEERAVLRKIQSAGGKAAGQRKTVKLSGAKNAAKLGTIPAKLANRNAAIQADYAKMSAPKLAQKYKLSLTWIREILHDRADKRSDRNTSRRLLRAIERVKAAGYEVVENKTAKTQETAG